MDASVDTSEISQNHKKDENINLSQIESSIDCDSDAVEKNYCNLKNLDFNGVADLSSYLSPSMDLPKSPVHLLDSPNNILLPSDVIQVDKSSDALQSGIDETHPEMEYTNESLNIAEADNRGEEQSSKEKLSLSCDNYKHALAIDTQLTDTQPPEAPPNTPCPENGSVKNCDHEPQKQDKKQDKMKEKSRKKKNKKNKMLLSPSFSQLPVRQPSPLQESDIAGHKTESTVTAKDVMKNRELIQEGTWVQCCKRMCQKWRHLRDIHDPSLIPEYWICSMNKDAEFNSCEKSEVEYDEREHMRDFIYTRYTEGSIVWARMAGYPQWPAMVEMDPDTEAYAWTMAYNPMIVSHLHVVFFDDNVSRAWIPLSSIKAYEGESTLSKTKIRGFNYSKMIKAACLNADNALKMPIQDRIAKYSFSQRFTGRFGESLSTRVNREAVKRKRKKVVHESSKKAKVTVRDDVSTAAGDMVLPKRDVRIQRQSQKVATERLGQYTDDSECDDSSESENEIIVNMQSAEELLKDVDSVLKNLEDLDSDDDFLPDTVMPEIKMIKDKETEIKVLECIDSMLNTDSNQAGLIKKKEKGKKNGDEKKSKKQKKKNDNEKSDNVDKQKSKGVSKGDKIAKKEATTSARNASENGEQAAKKKAKNKKLKTGGNLIDDLKPDVNQIKKPVFKTNKKFKVPNDVSDKTNINLVSSVVTDSMKKVSDTDGKSFSNSGSVSGKETENVIINEIKEVSIVDENINVGLVNGLQDLKKEDKYQSISEQQSLEITEGIGKVNIDKTDEANAKVIEETQKEKTKETKKEKPKKKKGDNKGKGKIDEIKGVNDDSAMQTAQNDQTKTKGKKRKNVKSEDNVSVEDKKDKKGKAKKVKISDGSKEMTSDEQNKENMSIDVGGEKKKSKKIKNVTKKVEANQESVNKVVPSVRESDIGNSTSETNESVRSQMEKKVETTNEGGDKVKVTKKSKKFTAPVVAKTAETMSNQSKDRMKKIDKDHIDKGAGMETKKDEEMKLGGVSAAEEDNSHTEKRNENSKEACNDGRITDVMNHAEVTEKTDEGFDDEMQLDLSVDIPVSQDKLQSSQNSDLMDLEP